jgi:hypothetical protein
MYKWHDSQTVNSGVDSKTRNSKYSLKDKTHGRQNGSNNERHDSQTVNSGVDSQTHDLMKSSLKDTTHGRQNCSN